MNINIKKYFIVVAFLLCTIIILSCAQNVQYNPIIDKKFEPLNKPAEITKLSEQKLIEQGYIKIGYIRAEQILKMCYQSCTAGYYRFSSSFSLGVNSCSESYDECSSKSFTSNATEEALKHAAQKGGQIVLFEYNNDIHNREAKTNSNICEHWSTEPPPGKITFSIGNFSINKEYQEQNCLRYRQKSGVHTVQVSSGSVWRKDD